MTLNDVTQKIAAASGMSPRRSGQGFKVRCPAHEDRAPSLSVRPGEDGKVLLYCFAGCGLDDILAAAGLTLADLSERARSNGQSSGPVAEHSYVDENGALLFQVVRKVGKQFVARRPDGTGGWVYSLGRVRRVPYQLPKVLEAVEAGRPVYIVEGEKDVHSVERAGAVATCNPGGAGKWRDEYTPAFTGAHVAVVADLDKPGIAHARSIAERVGAVAATLRLLRPLAGKDITDHLTAGRSLDELVPLDEPPSDPDPWDEPILLDPVVPPFPVDALPPVLRNWTMELAVEMQVPTDLVALQSLAAFSLVVAKKYTISPQVGSAWTEPVNLYAAVLLPSGTRKSPVHAACVAPLLAAERRLQEASAVDRMAAEAQRSVLEKRYTEAVKAASKIGATKKETDELQAAVAALASCHEVPLPPRLLIEDITPEKFGEFLARQNGVAGLFSDEGGIFGTMLGRYGGMANLDVFLKAFDGRVPLRVDRLGRNSIYCQEPLLAMGLAVQPAVLQGITRAHPDMRDRGLLPRFLFAMPSTTAEGELGRIGHREISPPTATKETREAFRYFLQQHAEQPIPEGGPVVLTLNQQASATFSAWREHIEVERRPEGMLAPVQAWGLKLEGQTLRLAALLHLAWAAASLEMTLLEVKRGCPSVEVGDVSMRGAIAVADYLIPHAIAVDDLCGGKLDGLESARILLAWIDRKEVKRFTVREVQQAVRSLKTAEEAEHAAAVLVSRGWAQRVETPHTHRPGRPAGATYVVHPEAAKFLNPAGWASPPKTELANPSTQTTKSPVHDDEADSFVVSVDASAGLKTPSADTHEEGGPNGRCARCQQPTRRYGDGGNPLCPDCRARGVA